MAMMTAKGKSKLVIEVLSLELAVTNANSTCFRFSWESRFTTRKSREAAVV